MAKSADFDMVQTTLSQVCVWMCMCVYVYICMCVCVYVCICVYMYIYVCVYVCICVYVCMCVYVYVAEFMAKSADFDMVQTTLSLHIGT
jgi:hypothetical protein